MRSATFTYGPQETEYSFDARLLLHLRLAIIAKLRRNESFTLTWEVPARDGSGRVVLWIHPSIPIKFTFPSSPVEAYNRQWVEDLLASAHSTAGMTLAPEPSTPTDSHRARTQGITV